MTHLRATPLDSIYRAHRSRLARVAGAVVRCPAEAEDVAQEAFLRWASKTADAPAPEANLGLLYRIARCLSLDLRRREASRRRLLAGAPPDAAAAPDTEQLLTAAQQARLADRALSELPPRTRAAFLMRRDEGLSFEAIGRRLGVSGPRAHQLAAAALAHLAQRLDGDGEDRA